MKDERNAVQMQIISGTQPDLGLGFTVGHAHQCLEPYSCAVATLANDPLLTTTFQNMSTSSGLLTFYDGPLVWIDCEMTGLDYNTDRILEIAVSAISF